MATVDRGDAVGEAVEHVVHGEEDGEVGGGCGWYMEGEEVGVGADAVGDGALQCGWPVAVEAEPAGMLVAGDELLPVGAGGVDVQQVKRLTLCVK